MPLRNDVKHLPEAKALCLLRKVQPKQNEVRSHLIAFILKMVLGKPHRVVAKPVHRFRPGRQIVIASDEVWIVVATI